MFAANPANTKLTISATALTDAPHLAFRRKVPKGRPMREQKKTGRNNNKTATQIFSKPSPTNRKLIITPTALTDAPHLAFRRKALKGRPMRETRKTRRNNNKPATPKFSMICAPKVTRFYLPNDSR